MDVLDLGQVASSSRMGVLVVVVAAILSGHVTSGSSQPRPPLSDLFYPTLYADASPNQIARSEHPVADYNNYYNDNNNINKYNYYTQLFQDHLRRSQLGYAKHTPTFGSFGQNLLGDVSKRQSFLAKVRAPSSKRSSSLDRLIRRLKARQGHNSSRGRAMTIRFGIGGR